MKLPRPRILFYALAVSVALLVVFSAAVIPWLVDSQTIKEKVGAALAGNSLARVTLRKMIFHWFPRPYLVVEDVAVDIDERVKAAIPRVEVYPSVVYLFSGRWIVRRALLQGAKLTVRLPEHAAVPFDFDGWEAQIRSTLTTITREWLGPRIVLSDGSAEIVTTNKPLVSVKNIAAAIAASYGQVDLEFGARSGLWGSFKVKGHIDPQSLAARLEIGVDQLKIKETLGLLMQRTGDDVPLGEVNVNATIAAVGFRQVTASLGGSTGPLLFARHGHSATPRVNKFKGTITYGGGALQADLEQLELGSPQLQATGQLKMNSGSIHANLKAVNLDIAKVGELARTISGDSEDLRNILSYVPDGTIPEISMQTSGHSFADLASRKSLVGSASLHHARLVIPGAGLEFANLAGSVQISAGTLKADDISANLGRVRAWNGALRLGLDGTMRAPFHLDMTLHAAAAELQSLLLKLIPDGALRGELLKVRHLEGDLSGKLTLGETIGAIVPVVAISQANLTATYDPVPFPIAVRGARLNYDQKTIRLESAQTTVGRSHFAGLDLTLHHDARREIAVEVKRSLLDLQQAHTLIRALATMPASIAKLQSARGEVELDNLRLTGAVDDPARWAFTTAGTVHQIDLRHADFSEPISLSKGKFAATQERLALSKVDAKTSDADLLGNVRIDYKNGGATAIEATGRATIGMQMSQWLSRYVALPEQIKVRAPWRITEGHLAWGVGGNSSFRGEVTAAGGAVISLDAVKRPQSALVKTLAIDDGDRHARISFLLAGDKLDGSFKGELIGATIDKIFTSFPMNGGGLRGDIDASAVLSDIGSISARGQLSGDNLVASWGPDKFAIDKFAIESSESVVTVASADVRWRNNGLSISGKIHPGKDAWGLDLDVSGDRLSLIEIDQLIGKADENGQRARGSSLPRFEGSIRLNLDSFATENFTVNGLRVRAELSSSLITADIERGIVCGVETKGRLEFADKNLDIDLQVYAKEAQLEPTTVCLSNRQSDIKGTYSLTGRLAAHGHQDDFLKSLRGNFEFRARDGEFIRSPGIDATFDYLNSTGDFKVEFPDLDREAFPYSMVGVKGRFEGYLIIGDEVSVESSLLNLSGQGKVDLEKKQIEGKGLIAILRPVDEVIRRIPVLNTMLGGSLIGIPVRVSGSLTRPDGTYLSPADLGADLLNIPLRILGIPLGAMQLFTTTGNPGDQGISQ